MLIYPLVERQPSKTVNLTYIYHIPKPRTIKLHRSVGKQRHLTSSLPGLHYYPAEKRDNNSLYTAGNQSNLDAPTGTARKATSESQGMHMPDTVQSGCT